MGRGIPLQSIKDIDAPNSLVDAHTRAKASSAFVVGAWDIDLRCKGRTKSLEYRINTKGNRFCYNEDKGDRWDITRFWNEAIFTDVAERLKGNPPEDILIEYK